LLFLVQEVCREWFDVSEALYNGIEKAHIVLIEQAHRVLLQLKLKHINALCAITILSNFISSIDTAIMLLIAVKAVLITGKAFLMLANTGVTSRFKGMVVAFCIYIW
jgi:hypothetical protein